MASLIVKKNCPKCGKVAVERNRITFGKSRLLSLECGHMVPEYFLSVESSLQLEEFLLADGRKPMPFQIKGIEFAELSNARCLIADEQGLGKTIQAVGLLKRNFTKLIPAVVCTKTTIKAQWMWEVMKGLGTQKVQILASSKGMAIPGFDVYITTYDILKSESVFAHVTPKTLILDECQAIKNHLSGRAKGVQLFVETHGIEHILALSGTPIKNNAGEYFTILNLLSPTRFPAHAGYLRDYCETYDSFYGSRVGGLSNVEYFKERTADLVIRRTQEEVLPDLFALKQPRKFQHVAFDNPKFQKAYSVKMKELEELFYAEDSAENRANQLAVMNLMRQITGLSKVEPCIDYIVDFILGTERKIVVFSHHHTVTDLLEAAINQWLKDGGYEPAVMYRAGDDRASVIKDFEKPESRVMIASTLASGEGFDGLQHLCSDMIILERQWNPANEEQVEGRIARFGQTKPCNFIYMIASETIDEYFTELVEKKRAIMAETLDGKETTWESNSLMRELAETLVMRGAKKWQL